MTVYDLSNDSSHAIHWTASTYAEPDYSYLDDPEETEVVVRWNSSPEVWLNHVTERLEYETLPFTYARFGDESSAEGEW